jgi:hypothetical protein
LPQMGIWPKLQLGRTGCCQHAPSEQITSEEVK